MKADEAVARFKAFAADVRARPHAYQPVPARPVPGVHKSGDAMRYHLARDILRSDLLDLLSARARSSREEVWRRARRYVRAAKRLARGRGVAASRGLAKRLLDLGANDWHQGATRRGSRRVVLAGVLRTLAGGTEKAGMFGEWMVGLAPARDVMSAAVFMAAQERVIR